MQTENKGFFVEMVELVGALLGFGAILFFLATVVMLVFKVIGWIWS